MKVRWVSLRKVSWKMDDGKKEGLGAAGRESGFK